MQLIKSENTTSFYESFSDLIFCTLVLFILLFLVMALSVDKQVTADQDPVADEHIVDAEQLQRELDTAKKNLEKVREEAKELKSNDIGELEKDLQRQKDELAVQNQQLEQLIGSNRFVGRRGSTRFSFAVDMSRVPWRYIPYPEEIQALHDTPLNGETASEKQLRQTLAKTQFAKHSQRTRHFTADELQTLIIEGVTRYADDDGKAADISLVAAGAFTLVASGAVDVQGRTLSARMLLKVADEDRFQELRRKSDSDPEGNLPTVKFQLTGDDDRPLSLGGIPLNTTEAVDFINAFSGRGVAVEVQPLAPDWFLDEVLKPTGYINRAPALTIE